MEAMVWSEVHYKQAALPKLRITEESSRRDSITSSRTGDSGYNSDPDISLSPLDFVHQDKYFIHTTPAAPKHGLSAVTFGPSVLSDIDETTCPSTKRVPGSVHNPILLKIHKDGQKTLATPRADITSNPGLEVDIKSTEKRDWTSAFKNPVQEACADPSHCPSSRNDVEQWIKENLPSQDRPKERVSSIVSLSSTGSCDMYSITDDSDEEEILDVQPSTLSKATLKTIELIMRKIELNLRYAAYVQCAGANGSRGQGSTANVSRGTGRGPSQSSGGKRKPRLDENWPPDDPDEEGSNKRRRVSITTTEESDAGPRFACPFYKHDPNRYRNRRTCPGPGWPTVHRMKEHLYRSHAQPIFCPRCYAMFDSDGEFSAHLRSRPCEISVPQPIEGIDRETLKNLRRRSPALRLEEDKWRDTYQLLFPDVSAADIPSPYYESSSPTEESRRFRRELLERIRQELFATAEREAGPVEQNLLRQVAAIIQRCESDLLASFQHTTMPPLQPRPAVIPTRNTPPTSHPLVQRHLPRSTLPMSAPPTASSFHPSQTGSTPPETGMTTTVPPHSADTHFVPHSSAQYNPPPWDDFQVSWSELIDWNAVFPPGPDVQASERSEHFVPLSAPVWT